jgi:ribonuclease HI
VPHPLVVPILCFNFAVWKFRLPAAAARHSQDSAWLCSHIVELSANLLSLARSFKKKKKVPNNSDPSKSKYSVLHDSLISDSNDGVAICYTDGSALSNPGPCGAGVSIFLCDSDLVVDAGVSLGTGTNNIGELVALFVCLTELLRLFETKHFSRAIVFSDSKYALSCATSKTEPTSNRDIVLILRATLVKARALFLVDLCWIKGHADIGGNTRADQLSKFFASAAPPCPGSDYVARARNYYYHSKVWRYGFPLPAVPSYYFRVPDSDLHLERWLSLNSADDIVARSLSEPLDFKHSN